MPPVLIVSGYTEDDGIDSDIPRLTKPFRNHELQASLMALSSTVAASEDVIPIIELV